jgi:molecular chaperone GrpE
MTVTAKPAERPTPDPGAEQRENSGRETPPETEAGAEVLAKENASLRDRLMRALADAENTRRRAERSVADTRQYAVADFAREMLAIADNLERAIAAAEQHGAPTPQDASLIEGARAIARMLAQIMARFGVQKVEAIGAPFNPSLHEAIMEVEDASQPGGNVVRVVEEGYTINDRLLRPARVVVAKRPREKIS